MPRIKTTRTVTIALYLLRIYLLGMLLIILTKFVMEARGRSNHEAGTPATVEVREQEQIRNPKSEISNKSELSKPE